MITPELLKRLMDSWGGLSCQATHLAKEINRVTKLRTAVHHKLIELAGAKEAYNSEVKRLNDELSVIRKNCNHEETEYFGDPAGGSDSHTQCLICGKEIR